MKISNPELKVIRFSADDVIATSLFFAKTSDVDYDIAETLGADMSGDYIAFSGVMAPYDDGDWIITNPTDFHTVDEDMMNSLKNYPEHYMFTAYTNEETWEFHTKGASFVDLYGNQ